MKTAKDILYAKAKEKEDCFLSGQVYWIVEAMEEYADQFRKPGNNNKITRAQNELSEQIRPFIEKYGKDLCNDFYAYWSEPNKSHSRLRYQMERTWEISRRINTWARNNDQWKKNRAFNNPLNGFKQEDSHIVKLPPEFEDAARKMLEASKKVFSNTNNHLKQNP